MTFSNFDELKNEILDYSERPDQASKVEGFIRLAEARLNRELPVVETDATLTGIVSSRRIDISSLSLVKPISLHIIVDGDEHDLVQRNDSDLLYKGSNGRPTEWAVDGTNIDFDYPCDGAYSFRFRFQERFALSASVPTNWLLTNHPDIYLAACLAWGAAYSEAFNVAANWQMLLDTSLDQVASEIRRTKRTSLKVDKGLLRATENRRSL